MATATKAGKEITPMEMRASKETAPISLRLPMHISEALEHACALYGRSKSELVRDLVWDGLKQLADKEKLELEREREMEALRRRRAHEDRFLALTGGDGRTKETA